MDGCWLQSVFAGRGTLRPRKGQRKAMHMREPGVGPRLRLQVGLGAAHVGRERDDLPRPGPSTTPAAAAPMPLPAPDAAPASQVTLFELCKRQSQGCTRVCWQIAGWALEGMTWWRAEMLIGFFLGALAVSMIVCGSLSLTLYIRHRRRQRQGRGRPGRRLSGLGESIRLSELTRRVHSSRKRLSSSTWD